MTGASWLAFGAESWQAFFHWLPITSHRVLGEGVADFDRLQSFYGLVRAHDGSETLAFAVQGASSIAAALGIIWLWRSRAPFDLKAAALAAATLVATPYVYMYDVTVLAVAVGFLLRYALARGFTAAEICGLAAGATLILVFPYVRTQTGLAAVLIVLALVISRLALDEAHAEPT
jgi:arabinofuranan 3-O-arabinosyltransferase